MTRARQFLSLINEGFITPAIKKKALAEMLDDAKDNSESYDLLCICDMEDEFEEDVNVWKDKRFVSKLTQIFKERMEYKIGEISQHIVGGRITVYREITAPPEWHPNGPRSLGPFWSWDASAAQAHWGEFSGNHIKWLLTAEVPVTAIGWAHTLAVNCEWSSEEECEIYVEDEDQLRLLKWERR